MTPPQQIIFENELFLLEQADFCPLPGYLILKLKNDVYSMSELNPSDSQHLGQVLALATEAIERIVLAKRVYCLSFCELEPKLHFHLFPRTETLATLYATDNHSNTADLNGALLFEWTRTRFKQGDRLPREFFNLEQTCHQLKQYMEENT